LERHRVIIGWLFEAVTMLLAVFVTFAWKKAFGTDGTPQEQQIVFFAIAVAALFLIVGLTLILNYRHAAWICVPFSVVMLFYVPIGTALGGYYLWYFWKFVYKRGKS
jgi:NADH:ubiquinone oxidoreductase subunit K